MDQTAVRLARGPRWHGGAGWATDVRGTDSGVKDPFKMWSLLLLCLLCRSVRVLIIVHGGMKASCQSVWIRILRASSWNLNNLYPLWLKDKDAQHSAVLSSGHPDAPPGPSPPPHHPRASCRTLSSPVCSIFISAHSQQILAPPTALFAVQMTALPPSESPTPAIRPRLFLFSSPALICVNLSWASPTGSLGRKRKTSLHQSQGPIPPATPGAPTLCVTAQVAVRPRKSLKPPECTVWIYRGYSFCSCDLSIQSPPLNFLFFTSAAIFCFPTRDVMIIIAFQGSRFYLLCHSINAIRSPAHEKCFFLLSPVFCS